MYFNMKLFLGWISVNEKLEVGRDGRPAFR